MALRNQFEEQGGWLFRWRSYLPLVIFPVLFVALYSTDQLERLIGDTAEDYYEIACILISFLGLGVRIFVAGFVPARTSGRNTKAQLAEQLNTKGIYSIVRHPLYLGNFLIFLGVAMSVPVWWFILIFLLAFFLYYERIMYAEEAFLREKFDQEFEDWARVTPAFVPNFSRWSRPDLGFSVRNVLRREYSGFFGIIAVFSTMELLGDLIEGEALEQEPGWIAFFVFGLGVYLLLRTLKKSTRILHVEGR